MIHRAKSSRGFTLVELMLALAFIAFVLMFAMTAIIDVMRTYNKGLVVKEINQTARTTMEDIAQQIRMASASTVNTSATAAGRLCLGGVSYVWNRTNATTNKYSTNVPVTLARVNDLGGSMCRQVAGTYPNVPIAQATPLLSTKVWVQTFTIQLYAAAGLAKVNLELSTTEDSCRSGVESQFCAVSKFATTVILKGR